MQPPHEFKPNLILLPHPLTTEGREVEYAAIRRNDTLASFLRRNEILPAPTAPIRVVVNGEYIPAAEWRKRRLSVGDHIEMRSMAQGSFGRIIGMIVIAIAAVWVGGLAAMAYTGTTSTAAAVAAGGGMVMAGVAAAVNILGGMLLNAVLPAQQEQTGKYGSATSSPTYSLSGSSNSLRRYEPMPLKANTDSVSTAPLSSWPVSRPTMVMIGSIAFFSTCRRVMSPRARPLAFAVRT